MAQLRDLVEAVKADDAGRVVELLGARPALARVTTEHEKTALHWAAEVDAVDAARVLLDSGAEIEARTSWGASPLDWAATMGSARVADLLLERGLYAAARNGHADTVALLLSRGAARGARDAKFDATPAGWAREGGHTELADLLEPTS